ncbi:hypothetical protein J5N58_17005 [Rhizobium cremeum]|uniref:hypothetical protein n=1 Tax=Rhizobium cremeum TaxID=2813827 RepID=UPI000DD7358B|nr:hypothetical protein [Rhizobium cremeum]MCJ7996119.1 hypothetical protein [Rhizobium cremeum]MCJ8001378.1 hypothetical protein [Rhizobium cremeum]
MARSAIRPDLLLAGLLFLATETAAADEVIELGCSAEVIYYCHPACEEGGGFADFSFSTKDGKVNYCRGERCDEGRIGEVKTATGVRDDERYVIFRIFGEGEVPFEVSGAASLKTGVFGAEGDVGRMIGTCSAGMDR